MDLKLVCPKNSPKKYSAKVEKVVAHEYSIKITGRSWKHLRRR